MQHRATGIDTGTDIPSAVAREAVAA